MEDSTTGTTNIKNNYGKIILDSLLDYDGQLNGKRKEFNNNISILEVNLADEETTGLVKSLRNFEQNQCATTYIIALNKTLDYVGYGRN